MREWLAGQSQPPCGDACEVDADAETAAAIPKTKKKRKGATAMAVLAPATAEVLMIDDSWADEVGDDTAMLSPLRQASATAVVAVPKTLPAQPARTLQRGTSDENARPPPTKTASTPLHSGFDKSNPV